MLRHPFAVQADAAATICLSLELLRELAGDIRPLPAMHALMTTSRDDERFVRRALALARAAGRRGEVPVGAVAVREGEVIAAAGNAMERRGDATAHAEMLALRAAARRVGGWRLVGVDMYATLEPCPMCAGAMVQARIVRCIYGARDAKKGADGSVYDVLRNARNNHRIDVVEGVLAGESAALLSAFFRDRRSRLRGIH